MKIKKKKQGCQGIFISLVIGFLVSLLFELVISGMGIIAMLFIATASIHDILHHVRGEI